MIVSFGLTFNKYTIKHGRIKSLKFSLWKLTYMSYESFIIMSYHPNFVALVAEHYWIYCSLGFSSETKGTSVFIRCCCNPHSIERHLVVGSFSSARWVDAFVRPKWNSDKRYFQGQRRRNERGIEREKEQLRERKWPWKRPRPIDHTVPVQLKLSQRVSSFGV